MIYDTFIFFNELEILDLRLHELNPVVDRFVLVESTRTFTNRPKPLFFQENRAAFSAFESKMIHVAIEGAPDLKNPWRVEDFQRNCIKRGLKDCRPDDIVLVSDVDEIPSVQSVRQAVSTMRFTPGLAADLWHRLLVQRPVPWLAHKLFKKWHPFVRVFQQQMHSFYLNGIRREAAPWYGTRMAYYRDVGFPNDLRCWKGLCIPNGGWHFTYLGGVQRVQAKLAAFSHQEFNTPQYTNPRRLAESLEKGYNFITPGKVIEYNPLDRTYPDYLLKNRGRFSHLIHRPV